MRQQLNDRLQDRGFKAFLIPDEGSMRVTRSRPTLNAIKKLAEIDLDDMLPKCKAIEVVYVKDRTAIEHKMVRRIA